MRDRYGGGAQPARLRPEEGSSGCEPGGESAQPSYGGGRGGRGEGRCGGGQGQGGRGCIHQREAADPPACRHCRDSGAVALSPGGTSLYVEVGPGMVGFGTFGGSIFFCRREAFAGRLCGYLCFVADLRPSMASTHKLIMQTSGMRMRARWRASPAAAATYRQEAMTRVFDSIQRHGPVPAGERDEGQREKEGEEGEREREVNALDSSRSSAPLDRLSTSIDSLPSVRVHQAVQPETLSAACRHQAVRCCLCL
ncbi:uncharacterized protein LOC119322208 isoform X2 [Triticum dicoccoides]|uniref:uncharacterized protein LOC119322208 isoform X2 n=1 Tax=Triticum dicoccoides TaxID=85692 RepID=UPI00188F3CAD|nr:uncharacterized protein LOC119322208 isoform X2 [Triticum dicoccoides]